MSGTIKGGIKTKQSILERYGEDYYQRIGGLANASWVKNGKKPKGFSAMTKEQRQEAGRKGGMRSKRLKP